MPSFPYAEGMFPPTDWGSYANHDSCFVSWLNKVDALCQRFLDIQLEGLLHEGDLAALDCYYDGHWTPEQFFKDAIVPYMASEHGQDFIDDQIGDMAMWGTRSGNY